MTSLLWVYPGSLARDLHKVSRLETATELARLGWEVTFVAPEVAPDELGDGVRGVRVPRPSAYFAGHLMFHLLLLKWIVSHLSSLDVILCSPESVPFLMPLAVMRRALGRATPKVVVDWRTVVMHAGYSKRGKIWSAYYRASHHLANTCADGQTAITSRLAQMVGIPERQLLGVWSSGVKPDQFRPAMSMRHWPLAHEPVHLIYLGVLEVERNLLALCEAVRMVRAEGIRVTLNLVGDGPQRRALEDYVSELGDGAVVLQPRVDRELVPAVLSTAHVGVLPFPDKPQFRVSSPIKLFEYMAAGMPILATRIVCHTDVLGDEDGVFWAEDGSPAGLATAVRKACARKAELESISERMSALAESWTWQASARRLNNALVWILPEARARELVQNPGKGCEAA